MSTIKATITELKKWSRVLAKIKVNKAFCDCPDPTTPDYSQLDNWLAHPNRQSKIVLTPEGLQENLVNEVPTFFIHPTSFFGGDNWNADIEDFRSRQLLEELVIPGQAAVFNHLGDVYMPIYRQATFYAFLSGAPDAHAALDLAYSDILRAFEQFLFEIGDTPFFIAAHSQGSLLGIRLLAERVEIDQVVRKRLVAAYLPGYKIPQVKFEKEFDFIQAGTKPDQVHCVLAWDTFLTGFNPLHHIDNASIWMKTKEGGTYKKRMTFLPFCINPTTWDIDKPEGQADQNLGAVINEYKRELFEWADVAGHKVSGVVTHQLNAPVPSLVSTKVGVGNILYVSKPKGRVYNIGKLPGGNYHVYDYAFFFMDIRQNASLRWKKYKSLYLGI